MAASWYEITSSLSYFRTGKKARHELPAVTLAQANKYQPGERVEPLFRKEVRQGTDKRKALHVLHCLSDWRDECLTHRLFQYANLANIRLRLI